MRNTLTLLILIPGLLGTAGCGKKREDPILRLSAQEALDAGKLLMEQKKYYKAEQHLTHAFEVEPNSRSGREALLLAADALFLRGGLDNFIRCESKYRDFINRFPTSERADYAQFQVGNCLAKRVEKPDRDQQVTSKALEAYGELLRLYPSSPHVAETHEKIREIRDLLAAHELAISSFYLRYGGGGLCSASINRLEFLQKEYPDFSGMDEVLYQLAVAYGRCRDFEAADSALEELRLEHPDSKWVVEAGKLEKEQAKKRARREGG